MARKPDPVRTGVTDLAQRAFRNGEALIPDDRQSPGYDVLEIDHRHISIRVNVSDDAPRYFDIIVRETKP